jgi:capsule polysaccharide export protein KpsE/RkpR
MEDMSSILEQAPGEAMQTTAIWCERYLPLLRLTWNHRIFLAKLVIVGLVVGSILAFGVPARYESTATLMPPDSDTMSGLSSLAMMASNTLGGDGDSASSVGGLAGSLLGAKSPDAPFIAILSSRTVEDDLINRFDLRRVYWKSLYVDTRKKLEKRSTIEEDKKTGVVTITVADHDPYRARDMVLAYIAELNKLIAQLNTSSAHQERLFLEIRLKTVKQDLDVAGMQLSRFSSRNATLDVENEGKSMVDAAATLQGELIAAQTDLRAVETAYAPANTRVLAAKARVAELHNQLRKLSGTDKVNDASDLTNDEIYPSIRKLPLLGATYYDLYREEKVREAAYEFLTKQYELAKLQEARAIPVVKVLDAPNLAEERSFPPRIAIIVLGALLAFACGVTWLIAPWRRESILARQ